MAQQKQSTGSGVSSLVGKDLEQVRGWVENYLDLCNLACSVDRLLAVASKIEGTAAGVTRSKEGRILHVVTKTKVRKARRRILSGK